MGPSKVQGPAKEPFLSLSEGDTALYSPWAKLPFFSSYNPPGS